jgi:hypothetical protein
MAVVEMELERPSFKINKPSKSGYGSGLIFQNALLTEYSSNNEQRPTLLLAARFLSPKSQLT